MNKKMMGIFFICLLAATSVFAANQFKKIDKVLDRMKSELKLTAQQVEDIRLIMEEKIGQRMDLEKTSRGVSKSLISNKMSRLNHEEVEAITHVLTPAQLKLRSDLEKKAQEKAKLKSKS